VVGVTVLWLFSVAITTLLHSLESIELSGATLWTLVIIKDSIIGLAALALVFLSTSGLFNSCYCWSTYMWHRWIPGDWGDKAYVQLTTSDLYDEWARKVYSPVVYGSLGLQVIYFFFVLILWWDGIYVVRWNEHRCRSEWHHEVGHGSPRIEYDESNYLVFWYDKHDITQLETIRVRRNSRFVTERRSSRPQVGSDVLRALRRSTGNF
jgi:hypothetical protein